MERKLILFVKNPEFGKVKTRLAKTIGKEKALDVYQSLIRYTKKIAEPLSVEKEVWYSNFIENKDIWDEAGFQKRLQRGNDLGNRMSFALSQSVTNGGSKRVVIIGSDCAELDTDTIESAFDLLEKYSLVVGPAKDGGYYLIGMNQFYPELFEEIEWSTENVLEQTLSKAKTAEISYFLLKELNDVDTKEDWVLVKDKL
ncbi:MAG: glycosyltransferase [Balneola sp.]|nr:MAG: glycosyltransferase [Balneola sp.]